MWGYYVAGGWLLIVGVVMWMFAATEKLHRRAQTTPEPVHPDDWAPNAPLWDEREEEQES
jgi:hypothetical protein